MALISESQANFGLRRGEIQRSRVPGTEIRKHLSAVFDIARAMTYAISSRNGAGMVVLDQSLMHMQLLISTLISVPSYDITHKPALIFTLIENKERLPPSYHHVVQLAR
jgi:hypothetical protein